MAATTIASLRQINSAEPGSPGTPTFPGGGGIPTTTFGLGTSTIGGATGTVATPSFQTSSPMRAYVVSSDITSTQEEESAIRKRRTL